MVGVALPVLDVMDSGRGVYPQPSEQDRIGLLLNLRGSAQHRALHQYPSNQACVRHGWLAARRRSHRESPDQHFRVGHSWSSCRLGARRIEHRRACRLIPTNTIPGGPMFTSYQWRFGAIFAVTLLSTLVWSQSVGNSGSVNGSVVDPTGAVVPNAQVEIRNPVSGFDRTTTADRRGKF